MKTPNVKPVALNAMPVQLKPVLSNTTEHHFRLRLTIKTSE